MTIHHTCPKCGIKLNIAFKPTNTLFEKIRLNNGLFCSSCDARLKVNIRSSYLALIFFIPYIVVLSWNIFVAQYGMERFGLDKIDQIWLGPPKKCFILKQAIEKKEEICYEPVILNNRSNTMM
jgi:hypothetical protein